MLGALLPRRERLSDVLSDERLEEGSRQRLLLAATLLQLLKAHPTAALDAATIEPLVVDDNKKLRSLVLDETAESQGGKPTGNA